MPRNRPVGVACGRPDDVHLGRDRRRELRVAHPGESFGHRRVRQHDDRLGGHHAAGGVVGVGHQPADRLGLLRLHQLEQAFLVGGGHLAQQVGRVVVVHRLEDVGRALVGERAKQGDLVVLLHLLQDVGKPLVVQCGGDLEYGACRACPSARWRRRRPACRPGWRAGPRPPGGSRSARGRRPRSTRPGRAAPGGARGGRCCGADRQPGDDPVAAAVRLDGGVDDGDPLAAVADGDRAVEQLGQHQHSLLRRSKRFMFTVPEESTTWSGSIRVTRPIGTKIRCRCTSSTTRPRIRGGWRSGRSIVTASRTLPSWSPPGSKTSMPASRARKIRPAVLTSALPANITSEG